MKENPEECERVSPPGKDLFSLAETAPVEEGTWLTEFRAKTEFLTVEELKVGERGLKDRRVLFGNAAITTKVDKR